MLEKEVHNDCQQDGHGRHAPPAPPPVGPGQRLQRGHEERGGAGQPSRLLRQGLHVRLHRSPALGGRNTLVSYILLLGKLYITPW